MLLVGLGGFLGAILRYSIGGYVQDWSGSVTFPYGTLAVNLLGCFTIGFLSYLANIRGALSPETRTFLIIGFLGSFTTFSTFANESTGLFLDGELPVALLNIAAHVTFGVFAVWLGRTLAFVMWR